MIRTAGRWNPREENIYFIATVPWHLSAASESHPYLLCAINEIANRKDLDLIERIANDYVLLIDSGVFSLANQHAIAHGMSMDEALALNPDEVDGFHALYRAYVEIMKKLGDRSWGYIEIDQGGRENKIKTRTKFEAEGLRPMPVYHPFNDGWDYFDYLAEHYDRICFGNVVQADAETRKRLLATAFERQRKYPHLWIHLLGMTPSEWLNAYPINSCDSSTWVHLVRWHDRIRGRVCCKVFSDGVDRMTYEYGSDKDGEDGYFRAIKLSGYDAHFIQRCWRGLYAEYRTHDSGAVPGGGLPPVPGGASGGVVPAEQASASVPHRSRDNGAARRTRDRIPYAAPGGEGDFRGR